MMDQYKEQYRKETEQIHAPADLIAKTKAAVRQEEARIQKERAMQAAASGIQEIFPIQKKRSPGMTARKWAYPLTAVAAIFILVSVSLMMRGLGRKDSDTASYELASEADNGAAESASEGTFEEAAPEEALVSEEANDEAAMDREVGMAETTEDTALDRGAASAETAGGAEHEAEMAVAEAAPVKEKAETINDTEGVDSLDDSVSELGEIENTMSQKQEEMLADEAAAMEGVTIKKVRNKPAFVNRGDIESRTYEDVIFQMIKEGDEWIAYVESDDGGSYVIRGGAETVEEFLERGYKKLLEIGF